MHGNYEWQQNQVKQQINKRMRESEQHRLARREDKSADKGAAHSVIRLPLRLVTAILHLGR
jgi:hypothetical protein